MKLEEIKTFLISISSLLGVEIVTLMEIDLITKIIIQITIGIATLIYLYLKIKNYGNKKSN